MKITLSDNDVIHTEQRLVFKTLVLLVIFAGTFFAILNVLRGLYQIAITEIICVLISTFLIFYIKKIQCNHLFIKISFSYLVVFYSAALYIMTQPQATPTVYVWIFLIPSLSYFLLGKKLGLYLSLPSILIAMVIYYEKFAILGVNYQIALANLIICMIMVWFVAHSYETGSAHSRKSLALMAFEDPLTKVYNRKVLQKIYATYKSTDSVSIVNIDIDFFKKINDNYGHHVGDNTLIKVAQAMQTHFDKLGYVIRLGGEEFCVVIPHNDNQSASQLTQEFLNKVRNTHFDHDQGTFHITFSAGVATYPSESDDFEELQKLADKRMYLAKSNGRNCIVNE